MNTPFKLSIKQKMVIYRYLDQCLSYERIEKFFLALEKAITRIEGDMALYHSNPFAIRHGFEKMVFSMKDKPNGFNDGNTWRNLAVGFEDDTHDIALQLFKTDGLREIPLYWNPKTQIDDRTVNLVYINGDTPRTTLPRFIPLDEVTEYLWTT